MAKSIFIKLTKASRRATTFSIYDGNDNLLASSVNKQLLIDGYSLEVDDSVTTIKLSAEGKCVMSAHKTIDSDIPITEYVNTKFEESNTASLWRHLTPINKFNNYYGAIHPYIIEYPFPSAYQEEIVQNIKDYSRVYKYFPDSTGVYNYNDKVETDEAWFNKAILYGGNSCSGLLKLEKKPVNNMASYLSYPKYNTDSKTILYTKSGGFYQYNTFWDVVKDKTKQLFITDCISLSIDKVLNQANMDYSQRSFKKAPLRGKSLKVRHILDDRSDIHIVSKLVLVPSQISYK